MNKITYTAILLLGFSFSVFSQKAPVVQWQKCIGGSGNDALSSAKILPTKNGTYVLVTTSNSNDGDFGNGNLGHYVIVMVDL